MMTCKTCCEFVALLAVVAGSVQASPADNKQAAINAMQDLFSKQDPSAVDRYFTSPYHQHNMGIPDGLDALKNLAKMATTWTGVHTNIVRGLADGDLVVLQSAYWNLVNNQRTAVAFDLFKFNEQGKITEHWDALEGFAGPAPAGHEQYDGATKITDLGKTEANRRTVERYLETVFIKGEAAKKSQFLSGKDFVDHGLNDAARIESAKAEPPGTPPWSLSDVKYVKFHKTVAEGNFVFVQGEGRLPGDGIIEVYDLFRIKDGKIVEHWDVHQALRPKEKWANPNGPF